MEDYSSITEQAREYLNQFHKQMKILETGQVLKAQAGQPSLALIFRDRGEDITLEGFLYPEQLEELKKYAVILVEARMGDAAALLGQMIRGDAEPAKQEVAVTPKPALKKEAAKGNPRKAIDEAEVRRLYLEEGKTAKEIAEKTGVTYSALTTFLNRHGITRRTGKPPEQEGFRGDRETGNDEDGIPAVDDPGTRLTEAENTIRIAYESKEKL